MKRRGFIGWLAASIASIFPAPTAGAESNDPNAAAFGKVDLDSRGGCMAQAYRRNEDDGCFYRIGRMDVRPGDQIIMLGLDGPRIWQAQVLTATKGSYVDRRGDIYVEYTNAKDLMEFDGFVKAKERKRDSLCAHDFGGRLGGPCRKCGKTARDIAHPEEQQVADDLALAIEQTAELRKREHAGERRGLILKPFE
jgi:hypothetical protein